VSADDLTWEPPGPGQWYYSAEHLPGAVSTLYAEIFPPIFRGWAEGAEQYGLPPHRATFGPVGRFLYYSPGVPGPVDAEALGRAAERTLATQRWRADLRTWAEQTRPTVVAAGRALLRTDLTALDDEALADHMSDAVAHFHRWGPQHFALMSVQATALGALFEAASEWGLDPADLLESLAGTASATASGEALLERIAAGVRAAGLSDVQHLDEIRALGGDAAAALDELLTDYVWRSLGNDLTPTLAERPDSIVAMIRAALTPTGPRTRPDPSRLDRLRGEVPEPDRDRFDDLVTVAQTAYGFNDDHTVVLVSLPMGIIRRAVLEVGRRLADRGRLLDPEDAFEATTVELRELLSDEGPPAERVAQRRVERHRASALTPPLVIGEPVEAQPVDLPPATQRLAALSDAWGAAGMRPRSADRAAAAVGTEVVRGRALVAQDPIEVLNRLEPGDVLVAGTTHAVYNTVFPLVAAVAVEQGGPMSHAAILARELGLTAVVGVPGLLDRVHDGDQVEVDPIAGTITVLDRAT
jgi:rifampicin phosphotransferase